MRNYDGFKGDEEDSDDYDPDEGRTFLSDPNTEKKKRKSAAGRKLLRWDCDIDQLVLLCVDHVCTKQGIAIPWDLVGKEINDTLTGEAIKQHLVKVRKAREIHGRQVPVKLENTERRKPADAYFPVTPVRARPIKTKIDDKMISVEKPLRNLVYLPDKKTKTVKTGAKRSGGVTAKDELPTPSQRSAKSGSGWKAEPKSATRGGKRSRASQKAIKEENSDSDFGSPSKKMKTKVVKAESKPQRSRIITLRVIPNKPKYKEPVLDDAELFDSVEDSPETDLPLKVDESRSLANARLDLNGTSTGAKNEQSTTSSQYEHESQSTTTHRMPQYVAVGRTDDVFEGNDVGPSPTYEDNYTMFGVREVGAGPTDLYGGAENNRVFGYNGEASTPRAMRSEMINNMEHRRSGRTPQPMQTYSDVRNDNTTQASGFDDLNELSSPLSSQSSFSNVDLGQNGLASSEVGHILIGNDTGRGDSIVTPTTVTFGLNAGARMNGLPQPYSLGGDSSVTFGPPTTIHHPSDGMQYYSGITQNLSGTMAYGMSNLGLNSGAVNAGQSFDSSYGSFYNGNSQASNYDNHGYSSDSYNAIEYEQQFEDDEVFGSPFVNMYDDVE